MVNIILSNCTEQKLKKSTYTVILRAWGDEPATRWYGWRARMAAIYMVLITPYTPEDEIL